MTLADLCEIAKAELRGDPGRVITAVSTLQDATEGTISFLANPRYKAQLKSTRASAVILASDDAADSPVDCLVSDNPYLAHARVVRALYPFPKSRAAIHPSALVDVAATVSESAEIGANCFVGAGVVIEDEVIVGRFRRAGLRPAGRCLRRCTVASCRRGDSGHRDAAW